MRKKCKTCKHWGDEVDWSKYRSCESPLIYPNMDIDQEPANGASAGGYEGYGDYFRTGSGFGCINWEAKCET